VYLSLSTSIVNGNLVSHCWPPSVVDGILVCRSLLLSAMCCWWKSSLLHSVVVCHCWLPFVVDGNLLWQNHPNWIYAVVHHHLILFSIAIVSYLSACVCCQPSLMFTGHCHMPRTLEVYYNRSSNSFNCWLCQSASCSKSRFPHLFSPKKNVV